jgi:glucose-6-phosphate 1-dehydrogenase
VSSQSSAAIALLAAFSCVGRVLDATGQLPTRLTRHHTGRSRDYRRCIPSARPSPRSLSPKVDRPYSDTPQMAVESGPITYPARLVILGVTSDLSRRYLMPAIAALHDAGRLPEDVEVVGVARSGHSTAELRALLRGGVQGESFESSILDRISYQQAQVDDVSAIREVIRTDRPSVIYLALPPGLFEPAIRSIESAGPAMGTRIVVEKPFGEGLASAQRLNAQLHGAFPEDAVFRVDHFLHKQTIQNLLGIRFANRAFEPLWNRDNIERVEIRWDERVALEGRAGYYDRAGALRDMIQNHLLQLASLVGMEAPATMNARDFRDRKV